MAVPTLSRGERRALRSTLVQPRLVVAVLLIVGAVAWASVRGLDGYGLTPIGVCYTLDQPPVLLGLVGVWLSFRSRAR
jgi:hypothetical protein